MNSQQIRAFALSRREENELKRTPPGAERNAYLKQINFKDRVYMYLVRSCPAEMFQPYICPLSKARYDDSTYLDKLMDIIMKKAQGEPTTCELAVGKEISETILQRVAFLFDEIPVLFASIRRVESSGNVFLVVAA